ncbi:MAG TPA: serine hydroxymethyltransferase, partial [Solirubrobacteraceae bacterium]|nr:serine hydroxymethyltransferase [Solirubrobacteraceae bacterium]
MAITSTISTATSRRFERVAAVDPDVADLLAAETERQATTIDLIPSENYASAAVIEAIASVNSAKYSEGYAGKRYYQGNRYIDGIEELAISRTKELFGAEHVNVQALAGVPANHAVYMALCQPGDSTMGIEVPSGGHLSHGSPVTFIARYYRPTLYRVDEVTEVVDYDAFASLARECRPKLIWVGSSSYPRFFDYKRLAEIALDVGSRLVADIAHVAGLVAGGVHPSPMPHADVVTTTTHKTLRGPRGALIMCREEFADAIDRAVFPGLQGGPFQHHIAGIAVALHEAQSEGFKAYARQVVSNAQALAEALIEQGFDLVSGGTDIHLMVVKLTSLERELTSKLFADALEASGLVVNRNPIPYDPNPPFRPSGIRFGTPAATTCGMKEDEMRKIAQWTRAVFDGVEDSSLHQRIKAEVAELRSS